MASPPRVLIPGTFVLITTRMETGLPLVPTAYMNVLLWGILGRAQELYPVTLVAFLFMANHLHILLVVKEPSDVVGFIDRIKTESAHAINRLLGRRRQTVWQDGYDAPTILTPEDAVNKLAYLYTNPQKAGLVDSIEEYPGVSSWRMFTEGKNKERAKWIRRNTIPKLRNHVPSDVEQERIAKELVSGSEHEVTVTLSPQAWRECFNIEDGDFLDEVIIGKVREEERFLKEERKRLNKNVFGAKRLLTQPMNKLYTPRKFSPRMWCICHDVPRRKAFISYIKKLLTNARSVLAKWRLGDRSALYPIGLFPPCFPKLANLFSPKFV